LHDLTPNLVELVASAAGRLPSGGIHAGLVAIEHEWQQHLERLTLARAVGPAQQQAPVDEGETRLVVLSDVEHPGTSEPVAVRVTRHQSRPSPYDVRAT
jgi:hypothetical protein